MLLFVLAIVCAVLFYVVCLKPLNYWARLGVPQWNCWVTLAEIVFSFVPYRPISESIQKMYEDFPNDRYAGFYQFVRPTLCIRDPDLIKKVTVKDFEHFVDHNLLISGVAEPLFEKNLMGLKGDAWKTMRSTLSPTFTASKMKIMFGLVNDYAKNFVKYFEEQQEEGIQVLEMKDTFSKFTNDVIATAAFGIGCNSLKNPDNKFYKMGKELITFGSIIGMIRMMLLIVLPRVAQILGVTMFSKENTTFFRNIVKETLETREKNGVVRPDMIHLLMEARKNRLDTEGHKPLLTEEDITAQALIFFFAGFESISTAMSFMAYELAVDADVQERLQNEIDDTLAECDGDVTYDALLKMKYLDMVVSETLRKWPVALLMDRICVKPYTIQPSKDGEKPLVVEKDIVIMIPVFGVHRDANIYPNPDRFDPERFSEENKNTINQYTYMPFGVGPRSCIGNRFALMELKLAFFHLLSKFDLTVVDKTIVPLKLAKKAFQLTAHGGFWLGLKRRKLN